ncbi:MAG TPA: RNA-binding S4 domain-containing protein [Bacteroidales bacterium]|jgi:ribosome-associated heat shock protein Hsp15|nr:RNA-binding S4 domain-containing protein [Bacteroidales bacterium]
MEPGNLRIDKYLWAVRVFKTRTLATEACDKGRVSVADVNVKPSRSVKPGDIITVRKPPVVHTYKVLALLSNRLSAEKVKDYVLELTSEEELQKYQIMRAGAFVVRDKGTGRPTKKDRRQIDKLSDQEDDEL